MKRIPSALLLLTTLSMMAFKGTDTAKTTAIPYGTFQAGCTSEKPVIKLTINEDHTFTYFDHSSAKKPIDVSGNWKLVKGSIVLEGDNRSPKFHDKWKIDPNYKCIRARKGITYYRLCSDDGC